jgi:WD40 repeat protein
MINQSKKSEITVIRQDLKCRKCYVADSSGDIKVYNINSGVELKDVTEYEKEGGIDLDTKSLNSDDYQSDGSKSYNSSDSDDNQQTGKEITDMQLIWEDDYILMICCDQTAFYVYDEDDTDVSYLLRKVTGGNKSEISIIKYSNWLGLLATGSVDGDICIWDFEMSKVDGICLGHT